MFKNCNTLSVGLIWVPAKFEKTLLSAVEDMRQSQNVNGPHLIPREPDSELTPPTFFDHNCITGGFQMIVDTYGIPEYKEANPALFTIVTFPFLFGVMFGDVMHGGMLFAFGIWLCLANRTPTNIPGMVAPFRHFILMMGFFSLYCGFIYNDYTSVGLYLFGPSCYEYHEGSVEPTIISDCVYPIGFDPSWYLSDLELN